MSDVVHHAVTAPRRQGERDQWRPDGVDPHLVSLLDPSSFEADQYRALRHILERGHPTKKLIAITSAMAGDGKTTTALNLAGTLSRGAGVRVLAIDLDLRTRSLGNSLGLVVQDPGLVDLILDPDLSLNDVIRRHSQFPLSVLPAGPALTVPYELLKSPRMAEILAEITHRYDYIIMDTPPLVPVPDFRLIADLVDGFMIVVAAHRTPRKLLEEALGLIDPAKLIGIVFNGDDRPLSGYYGYYHGHERRLRAWLGNRSVGAFLNWLDHLGK